MKAFIVVKGASVEPKPGPLSGTGADCRHDAFASGVYACERNSRAAAAVDAASFVPCRKESFRDASRSSGVDPAARDARTSAYVSCAQKRTFRFMSCQNGASAYQPA